MNNKLVIWISWSILVYVLISFRAGFDAFTWGREAIIIWSGWVLAVPFVAYVFNKLGGRLGGKL